MRGCGSRHGRSDQTSKPRDLACNRRERPPRLRIGVPLGIPLHMFGRGISSIHWMQPQLRFADSSPAPCSRGLDSGGNRRRQAEPKGSALKAVGHAQSQAVSARPIRLSVLPVPRTRFAVVGVAPRLECRVCGNPYFDAENVHDTLCSPSCAICAAPTQAPPALNVVRIPAAVDGRTIVAPKRREEDLAARHPPTRTYTVARASGWGCRSGPSSRSTPGKGAQRMSSLPG